MTIEAAGETLRTGTHDGDIDVRLPIQQPGGHRDS